MARTIYRTPLTVALRGELGAGKTTLLQGFAEALGVLELLTSPTFALEQRYATGRLGELLHIDLYRLSEPQAKELLHASDAHNGIRCVEWADRHAAFLRGADIDLHLIERDRGRGLAVMFRDARIPDRARIERWRAHWGLPPHVAAHCDAVAGLAVRLADALIARGTIVRRAALRAAAELHDLLRFLDFKPGMQPESEPTSEEQRARWEAARTEFLGLRHEAACAALLRREGSPELADIVKVHGLILPSPERRTIEQQLLYYADKRTKFTDVVTLQERFDDFRNRYGGGKATAEGAIWFSEAQAIERELFPDGVPC